MSDDANKATHTPAPWKVGYSDGSAATPEDGYTITAGDHGAVRDLSKLLTVVSSRRDDWGLVQGIDNEANARLIAAAPDLLAALRPFVDRPLFQGFSIDEWNVITSTARAAIAKAEGL